MTGKCFEEATDYRGQDIRQINANAEGCQAACAEDPGCEFWTVVKSINKCHLKGAKGETISGNEDLVSGPKNCEGEYHYVVYMWNMIGFLTRKDIKKSQIWQTFLISSKGKCFEEATDYWAHDIIGIVTETVQACQKACANEPACNVWTYVKSARKCHLKYAQGEVKTGNADLVSGPKECEGTLSDFLWILWCLIKLFLDFANLRKRYCGLSLVAKRILLESDEVSADQVESLLASVR